MILQKKKCKKVVNCIFGEFSKFKISNFYQIFDFFYVFKNFLFEIMQPHRNLVIMGGKSYIYHIFSFFLNLFSFRI